MLSHEIIRPLTEMFDTDQQYFRLANGDVIRADFRQAGLNTDAMPGTVKIGTVDPKIMPSAATTAIQPWDKARPNIRAAIQKWVQDGAKNTAPTAEGEEPKTIWSGGLTIQGPHSDAMASHLDLDDELDENLHKWFKEKWVRFGPDGKIRGDCARGSDSEGKPKCLPQSKAHALGKKGRASAAAKKRREDPNPERRGAAINVATKKKTSESKLDEKCWDTHRQAGMKRKGDRMVPNCVPRESKEQCPECGGDMYPDSMIAEKKDACYYKVKSRYKVWPSAYASGALVKCRKKGAKNWGNKSEGVAEGSNDWSGPLYDPALQGNGKKQRYEMMFKNGQVKRFSAMNDNEARKIAAGHGAKSVIRMKGNVPGDKIKEQGVAEGLKEKEYIVIASMDDNDYELEFRAKTPEGALMQAKKWQKQNHIREVYFTVKEKGVAEGSDNLDYIGNCTEDDVIEHIFGDATNFAQAVDEHGDDFTVGNLVVKYDPETDVHSFYRKKPGVAESFDQPYPMSWEKGDFGDNDALAKLDDGTYLHVMFNLADRSANDWGVAFYRGDSQSVTGQGDAQRVFATVLAAIGQFVKKQKPDRLFFTAVKEEDPTGSRAKLYDRLVQKYATGLGYELQKVDYPQQTGYKLTRKEQKTSQANKTKQPAVAEDQLAEKWSQKYKKSINCNNPRGFSQRAHCAGRKKNESADDPDQFGGMHVDDFQQKLMRLKKLAGAGPLQTVYDPKQRVYRNMPTAQQPPRPPKK